MNPSNKQQTVDELSVKFAQASASFLVDYRGCSCKELTSLRNQLRPLGAKMAVIKNTLARRALVDTSVESINEQFAGPTAVVWAGEDLVSPAKVLCDFGKKTAKEGTFKIKGGIVEGSVVDAVEVQQLADLPTREELLAKLLAVINAPAIQLLRTINAPASSLVRVLGAWKDKISE